VVTFGDPFQGAPIKGYKGPIMVSPNPEQTVPFFFLPYRGHILACVRGGCMVQVAEEAHEHLAFLIKNALLTVVYEDLL
jgi:hypothetical protein